MTEGGFGDAAGLYELARVYKKAIPEFSGAARALDHRVEELAGDAWSGQARAAFTDAWEKDSRSGQALSELMRWVAGTVDRLAGALGQAKRSYEDAVATSIEHGVPMVIPGRHLSEYLTPEKQRVMSDVNAAAAEARRQADTARARAIAELEPVLAILRPDVKAPSTGEEEKRLTLGDRAKLGALAADLYAVPAEACDLMGSRMTKLIDEFFSAHKGYSMFNADHSRVLRRKRQAVEEGRRAFVRSEKRADKLRGSRAAATDLGDVVDRLGGDMSKLKIVKDVPVVESLLTAYNVYDDVHNEGWGLFHAVGVEAGATLVGTGAGALAKRLTGTAIVALAPEATPAIVAAGVGIVAGYEATEAFEALTHDAHWGANIDKYGVIGGVEHSLGDAGTALVHDNVEMAEKMWDTGGKAVHEGVEVAKKAWGTLKSIL